MRAALERYEEIDFTFAGSREGNLFKVRGLLIWQGSKDAFLGGGIAEPKRIQINTTNSVDRDVSSTWSAFCDIAQGRFFPKFRIPCSLSLSLSLCLSLPPLPPWAVGQ
jgi:hypothetical protein